jgi:hypothetical protein
MVYGAMRSYNNFQNKSSPSTYFGIAAGVALINNIWMVLSHAPFPTRAGVGGAAAGTLFQIGMTYATIKAGEQIGLAALPSDKEEIRRMLGGELQREGENRELR